MVRFWPCRAISREINLPSPDATADGRDRRRAHETHLERRGSLQSEEMTTNRARARTSSALIGSAMVRVPPNGSKSAHILHVESLLGCFEAATLTTSPMGMIRRSILRRLVLLGPRRAPKCRFGWTLKKPKTATFGTIILDLNLFDRSFLRQLPSQLQYGAGGTLSHSILCEFGRFRLPWRQNGTKKPNVYVCPYFPARRDPPSFPNPRDPIVGCVCSGSFRGELKLVKAPH